MALQAWLEAHPLATTAIVWSVFTFVAFAFKARTPEEYAAMPPRLAAFLQLLGALFGDGRKIAAALVKVITGRSLSIADATPTSPVPFVVDVDDSEIEPTLRPTTRERAATPREGQGGFANGESLGVLCSLTLSALLFACVKTSPAHDAAANIAKRNAEYDAEVKACSAQHSRSCAAFNACQRSVAVKYGARLRGRCEEVTPAQAADAGLLPAGRL